jgi:hypothetical protein
LQAGHLISETAFSSLDSFIKIHAPKDEGYPARSRTPTPLPLLVGMNSMPASSRARRKRSRQLVRHLLNLRHFIVRD